MQNEALSTSASRAAAVMDDNETPSAKIRGFYTTLSERWPVDTINRWGYEARPHENCHQRKPICEKMEDRFLLRPLSICCSD